MLKADYYTAPTDLDRLIFEKLVPADHYLRQVKAAIDFEPMRALVADCYSPTMGRGAEDPVMMLKLSVLQFQDQLSDREVIEAAQVNLAYRFFLDLSLESQLPVASLLSQFRARLGAQRLAQVFDDILRQARAHGVVKDRLRLKDATHVIACVAIPTTIRLVAQVRERVLRAAQSLDAEAVARQHQRAADIRQATRHSNDQQRLLERVEHLREIVAWADSWPTPLESRGLSQSQQAELSRSLELAHKVLNDRQEQAHDQVRSAVDPDVRTGRHHGYYNGYLLDVSLDADSELICALEVLAANGDEAANTKALIEAEEATQDNDIAAVSLDSIGFRGDVLRELEAEPGPQVDVYVPPYPWPGSPPGLFKPEDFQLNETGDELRCPGGQTTRSRTRANRGRGWQFQFRQRHCRDCAVRQQCLKPETRTGRTVVKSDYEAEYTRARQRALTDDYQAVRKEHPKIERKLAEMIRWHGGRRVRYRGRWRVKIQYLLTACVVNIKRLVKLLTASPLPRPA